MADRETGDEEFRKKRDKKIYWKTFWSFEKFRRFEKFIHGSTPSTFIPVRSSWKRGKKIRFRNAISARLNRIYDFDVFWNNNDTRSSHVNMFSISNIVSFRNQSISQFDKRCLPVSGKNINISNIFVILLFDFTIFCVYSVSAECARRRFYFSTQAKVYEIKQNTMATRHFDRYNRIR